MNITKTEDTKEFYIKRSKQLMIRAYEESLSSNNDYEDNAITIEYNGDKKIALPIVYTVIWAVKNLSGTLMQSSWKLYRSAMIYYAEQEFENSRINEKQFKKVKELLKKTRSEITKGSENTSGKKKKSFNAKEIKQIDGALKNSRSRWSNPTRIFIRAGKYTGLRPIEWKAAELVEEKKVLIVKNAKNSNGRSFADQRVLSLKHLDDDKIKDIKLHLILVKKMVENNSWDLYYGGCSSLLRRLSRKLWPSKKKYPSLYSCRHQFSADMKASGCSKREVAALMGHASERTAESHYGKKIHGTRGKKPSISKLDVSLIKKSEKQKFKFD